ncbi:MAG: stress-inducible protein [Thermomicrobiales bacterium]|nr:stress-inducible protein [Thermomicrobiales bacterium]
MVLCRPLLGIEPNPSTKDAQLIAFRVGEYHPGRVTLPDIGPPSIEGKEAIDFCGLIDRTEVKMDSVLACLLLRNRHKQQARHPIRSRPNLARVGGVAHDNPAQGLGPPSTKRDRIMSVNDDLLPNEIHVAHSAGSVSQTDGRASSDSEIFRSSDSRDAELSITTRRFVSLPCHDATGRPLSTGPGLYGDHEDGGGYPRARRNTDRRSTHDER